MNTDNTDRFLDARPNGRRVRKYLDFFDRYVEGQARAKEMLVSIMLGMEENIREPNKPAGVIALFGPSGVGKTYSVRILAKLMFGHETALTEIECQSLKEPHTVSSLIGAPPGYIGFNAGDGRNGSTPPLFAEELRLQRTMDGIKLGVRDLENKVRFLEELKSRGADCDSGELMKKIEELTGFIEWRKTQLASYAEGAPYSIALVDEIEKAHPTIFDIFLSILDYGRITMKNGKNSDFTNTILAFTGNIAEDKFSAEARGRAFGFRGATKVGKDERSEHDRQWTDILEPALQRTFNAPLLGRIGKKRIVLCHSLDRDQKLAILDRPLMELQSRLDTHRKHFKLEVSMEVRKYLLSECEKDPHLGMRALTDLVMSWIYTPLVFLLAKDKSEGGIVAGDTLLAVLADHGEKGKKIEFKLVAIT